MAGKRGPRLRTVREVSSFMSKLIRETYRGELDPALAGRLDYLANILKGCLETGDLERQIGELWEKVERLTAQ